MKADCRFIKNVADAAQVGSELCSEPDALTFAARERRRAAVKRQVVKPDVAQKSQTGSNFCDGVSCNLRISG